MSFAARFRQPKNELEKGGRMPDALVDKEAEATLKCPECNFENPINDLVKHYHVCRCGHHFRISARQRIEYTTDEGSFSELFTEVVSKDPIKFPGYADKYEQVQMKAKEPEAVICGTAAIGGQKCAMFVMNPHFMMGSMGAAVGEKITLLFEHALENSLPVIGCTVSGGARMQEGIVSLMQMAKTSGAVQRHSDAGNFYLTLLTDPTTGGVTASFAMQGDMLISEPGAIIGFAGARVVEQAVRKKLPPGFQKAEFLLEHGFLDNILPRAQQQKVLAMLLKMHTKEAS